MWTRAIFDVRSKASHENPKTQSFDGLHTLCAFTPSWQNNFTSWPARDHSSCSNQGYENPRAIPWIFFLQRKTLSLLSYCLFPRRQRFDGFFLSIHLQKLRLDQQARVSFQRIRR